MKSKKIMLLLSLGILGVLSPQRVLAQSETTQQEPLPILAEEAIPENPVVDWRENPVNDAKQLPVKQKRETLLPILDPRGTIRETPVRDQGQLSICWAYSTTDVLAIAKATQLGEKATFSPNYWNYRFAKNAFSDALNPKVYYGRSLDTAVGTDNVLFSTNLGRNPVSESYLNTPKTAGTNQPMLSQDFQLIENKADKSFEVTDTLIAPVVPIAVAESKRLEKVTKIKSLVKNYGAVTYNIYSETSLDLQYVGSNSKFSQKKDGKYTSHVPLLEYNQVKLNDNKDNVAINHAVTIVGWDDTFDKSMFKTQPKNNGAFIVKNSWGTAWGDKGYFYVSYEDMYVTLNRHLTSKVKKIDDETLKTYVTSYGWIDNWGPTVANNLYIANAYDVEERDKTLKAVGFYNLHAGLKYEVYFTPKEIVDIGISWSSLSDYEKIGEGTLTDVGLQKISVTEKDLSKIKSYGIAVRVVNSKEIGKVNIPLQEVNEVLNGENEVVPSGKSFYSNQTSLINAYWQSLSATHNTYVNAYVEQEKSELVETVNLSILNKANHAYILHNYPETLEIEISSQNYTSSDLKWTSSDTSILTVDSNGKVTGKGSGKVTVRVELKNDAKVYDTIDMTVDDHGDSDELATPAQLGHPIKVTNDWIIPAMVVSYGEYYDRDMLKYKIPADGEYTVFLEPQGNFYTVAQVKVNGEVIWCDVSPNISSLWPSNEKKGISLKKGDEVIVSIWGDGHFSGIWGGDRTHVLPQLKQYSLFTLSQED